MQSAVHKVAPFLMPPATFMMIQDSRCALRGPGGGRGPATGAARVSQGAAPRPQTNLKSPTSPPPHAALNVQVQPTPAFINHPHTNLYISTFSPPTNPCSLDYATILARVKQAQAVGRTILALLAAAALHTASRLLARAAAGGA